MKKSIWKQNLKDRSGRSKYLTKALKRDDPEELQWMLHDVVKANGWVGEVSRDAGLSEWRLRLMLMDEEEAWKLTRLSRVMGALGLRLLISPKGGK